MVWGVLALIFYYGGFLVGFVILAIQSLSWLRSGIWPALPVHSAFDHFGINYQMFSWIGVQRLIDLTLELPLSFTVVCFGLLLGRLHAWFAVEAVRAKMEQQSKEWTERQAREWEEWRRSRGLE
jgi:hypothetical protein